MIVALAAEPAPELGVRDRLDVEHQAVGAAGHAPFFIRTANGHHQPRLVGKAHVTFPGAQVVGDARARAPRK